MNKLYNLRVKWEYKVFEIITYEKEVEHDWRCNYDDDDKEIRIHRGNHIHIS